MTEAIIDLLNSVQANVQHSLEFRQVILAGAGVLGLFLFVQAVLALWTIRRLREIGQLRERLARLADGLALLTDTTEAGLSTIIREVEQMGRRQPAPRAPRASVAKRVTAAAKRGAGIADIAGTERLSESEVRLHLSLADARKNQSGISA